MYGNWSELADKKEREKFCLLGNSYISNGRRHVVCFTEQKPQVLKKTARNYLPSCSKGPTVRVFVIHQKTWERRKIKPSKGQGIKWQRVINKLFIIKERQLYAMGQVGGSNHANRPQEKDSNLNTCMAQKGQIHLWKFPGSVETHIPRTPSLFFHYDTGGITLWSVMWRKRRNSKSKKEMRRNHILSLNKLQEHLYS